MPNNKSAKKRVEIGERNRQVNAKLKSKVKTLMKSCLRAAQSDGEKAATAALALAFKFIDKGAKGSTYHKNKAARLKSRLTKKVKATLKTEAA